MPPKFFCCYYISVFQRNCLAGSKLCMVGYKQKQHIDFICRVYCSKDILLFLQQKCFTQTVQTQAISHLLFTKKEETNTSSTIDMSGLMFFDDFGIYNNNTSFQTKQCCMTTIYCTLMLNSAYCHISLACSYIFSLIIFRNVFQFTYA